MERKILLNIYTHTHTERETERERVMQIESKILNIIKTITSNVDKS